jgi:hypothetical protein
MPTADQARALADLYQLDDDQRAFVVAEADRYHRGRRDSRYHVMPSRGSTLSVQRAFTGLDDAANRIRAFSAGAVAGSTQTLAYCAAMFGEPPEGGPESLERRKRGADLPRNAGRRYELVVTEGVAVASYGSDAVMADQFDHLVALSGFPNVDLRVITRGTPGIRWEVPGITIYDDAPVILGQILKGYVRLDAGDARIPEWVGHFEELQAAAAAGDDARGALAEIAAWYRARV